jgi:hypothetical protein
VEAFDFNWAGPPDAHDDTVAAAAAFHEQHGSDFPALPTPVLRLRGAKDLGNNEGAKEKEEEKKKAGTLVVAATTADFDWRDLPDDVWLRVCGELEPEVISALLRTSTHFAEFGDLHRVFTRRGLRCFHTKKSLEDCNLRGGSGGGDTLGICLQTRMRPLRATDLCSSLQEVVCHFDVLSLEAFSGCSVRRGIWKEKLDHWLPLVLDGRHAERALPLLEQKLSLLASPSMRVAAPAGGGGGGGFKFNPLVALEVLPRVMNAMVVQLMETGATSLHASEKTLLGFCALHHILLELAAKYPVVAERAQHWVAQFELHESRRNKHVVHDLGELLVLLYLCPAETWRRLAPAFVQEVLVRNVLWNLKKDPSLALLEPRGVASAHRLHSTLACCKTSLRLVMFQAFFLQEVGAPQRHATAVAPLAGPCAEYRQRLSRPRPGTAAKLQAACVDILGQGRANAGNRLTWAKFFGRLGLPAPDEVGLSARLRAAVETSEGRGYHTALDGYDREEAEEMRGPEDWQAADDGPPATEKGPAADAAAAAALPLAAAAATPMPGRRLWVGNLPFRCCAAEVRQLFAPFGAVLSVELPEATGAEADAAAARAVDKAAAEARQIMREHGMLARPTRMALQADGGFVAADVGNLAIIQQAAALRPTWRGGHLAEAGAARQKRGFGYVVFADKLSAEAALAYGNGRLTLGRRAVKVDWAGGPRGARRAPPNGKGKGSGRKGNDENKGKSKGKGGCGRGGGGGRCR